MNTIFKLIGFLTIIGALVQTSEARPYGLKPNVDPAHLICTIVFPNGAVIHGNDKNDKCHIYEDAEDVEIFYHIASYPWTKYLNNEEFLCELETGKIMQIIKNVYRTDEYIVNAFGHTYTAYGIYTSPGISDQLVVKNTSVGQFEPTSIIFKSEFGAPTKILVHLQGGRAPESYKISCKQIL